MSDESLKLTKRQVTNLRAVWMRKARMIGDRLIQSVIGEPLQIECHCGAVHEAPGTGDPLSTSQVGAAKIMFGKVFPDIAPEDFESAVETTSPEEMVESLSRMIKKMPDKQRQDFMKYGVYITLMQEGEDAESPRLQSH